MSRMRALVLSPLLSQSISCARILRAAGRRVIGGFLDGETSSRTLSLYDGFVRISHPNDLAQFDFVIPTGSRATQFVFSAGAEVARVGEIAFRADSLRANDKTFILGVAAQSGIPTPRTWTEFAEIAERRPVFYKPAIEGVAGKRSWAMTPEGVPESVRHGQYIFQDVIAGRGTYGYGFLATDGRVLTSVSHHEIYSYPKDGGSAAVIRPIRDERLEGLAERLIRVLNYSGWGLVEFKWCPKREQYVLMELNAKMWASIELAFRTEPLFVELLFGIIRPAVPTEGLVWLQRLLASGPRQLWSARSYLLRFSHIYEPMSLRSAMALIIPERVKEVLRTMQQRMKLKHAAKQSKSKTIPRWEL